MILAFDGCEVTVYNIIRFAARSIALAFFVFFPVIIHNLVHEKTVRAILLCILFKYYQGSSGFALNLSLCLSLFVGYFLSRCKLQALAAFLPSAALTIYYHHVFFTTALTTAMGSLKVSALIVLLLLTLHSILLYPSF